MSKLPSRKPSAQAGDAMAPDFRALVWCLHSRVLGISAQEVAEINRAIADGRDIVSTWHVSPLELADLPPRVDHE